MQFIVKKPKSLTNTSTYTYREHRNNLSIKYCFKAEHT